MREANTKILNFVGTPEGWQRVGFTAQDGVQHVAMVKMGAGWSVEVHIEEGNLTCYCIGVSPDKERVIAERWLVNHSPKRLEYANLTEQQAAMAGQDATTLNHAGIVNALKSALTSGDNPLSVPARTFNLTPVNDTHTIEEVGPGLSQRGDLCYQNQNNYQVWWFILGGRREAMRTMSELFHTRHVYKNGLQEIFFLFEIGNDYLLEHVRPWEGALQRRHVQVPKATVTATEPPDIIEELDPQLVYDPDAFA